MPTAASRSDVLGHVITEWGRSVALADPSRLEAWEDLGLTMSQLRVLVILQRDPGVTAGRLADRLGVRPSTVTGIVDRIVKQDLVERQPDPDDRRVVRNTLTDQGQAVVTEISRKGRAFITRVLDSLTDEELQRLLESLTILTSRAESMGLLLPPLPEAVDPPAPASLPSRA